MGETDDKRKRTRWLEQAPVRMGAVGSSGQVEGLALTSREESSSSGSRREEGDKEEGRRSKACGYDEKEEVRGLQFLNKVLKNSGEGLKLFGEIKRGSLGHTQDKVKPRPIQG